MAENGIWVEWDGSREGVPPYAVVGGTDVLGGPIYVIRATHCHTSNDCRGKIVGRYSPYEYEAFVPYYNKAHGYSDFEVSRKFYAENKLKAIKYLFLTGTDAHKLYMGG